MNNEDIKELHEEYYATIGISPNSSRKADQVQARAALMVAMANHITKSATGKSFGKDHSTVIHHQNQHEANMLSWKGYEEKYLIAYRLCCLYLKYKSVKRKLKTVRIQIKRLEILAENLKQEIG
tara:strand:+ start:4122 stop:4493 length:372 start_codon:yes stop_codon:yes gene_type:complete